MKTNFYDLRFTTYAKTQCSENENRSPRLIIWVKVLRFILKLTKIWTNFAPPVLLVLKLFFFSVKNR